MTREQSNAHPLPPMDESLGVTHKPGRAQMTDAEWRAAVLQRRYQRKRRAHAEAIGRPYPEERHPVWPR